MSKNLVSRMSIVFMMVVAAITLAFTVSVRADNNVTVSGTITDDTNESVLYLSTSGGTMQLKFDSNSDVSGCRMIFPGKKATVTCYRGSDAYMHVSSITDNSGVSYSTTLLAESTKATVKGTVSTDSEKDVLFLDTSDGTMQIKIDSTTDFSGCSFLMPGRKVTVVVERGSDAYMHAVSFSDGSTTSSGTIYSSSGSLTSGMTSTTINGISMPVVSGTIDDDTNSGTLFLDTSSGTMEITLDLGTDVSECRAIIPDRKVIVACYRGVDACMHAAKLVDGTSYDSVTLDSSTASVEGKITDDSEGNIIYLKTSNGTMQIKLDQSTDLTSCGVMFVGDSVKIKVARGSDAYMHAISVTDRS